MSAGEPARPRNASILLILLVGACLLSLGLGGDRVTVAAWMGGTLLFGTTLLPRLPSMKGGEIWIGSHGLAASAFWTAIVLSTGRWPLLATSWQQNQAVRSTFAAGILAAALAVALGWGLDRAARRAPALARRLLALTLIVEVIVAACVIPLAHGDAPSPSERLAEGAIVGHLAQGATRIDTPLRVERLVDGRLVALGRAAAAFDALPMATRDRDHVVALYPPGEGGYHVCGDFYGELPALDVRVFHVPDGFDTYLFTREHVFEQDDDIDFLEGCNFDARGISWRIAVRNVRHPVRTSGNVVPVALAALTVALIQIAIAIAVAMRHRRLRRATEGVSDGEGRATLANGLIVDLVAPAGPVLVALAPAEKATYREGAKPRASLLAQESRASADERMDRSTCIALVAAVGTLSVAILPFVALLALRMVAPF